MSISTSLDNAGLRIAEEDHRLSAPSRANAQDQDEISNLVVEALRPIMEHEEQKEGLVPFPAAWISRVTGIRCVVRIGIRWSC